MKAGMEMRFDTTWGNQIILTVGSELDNPSVHGTRDIAALMVHSLHAMLDEVRAEDERFRREGEPQSSEQVLRERGLARHGGTQDARMRREDERFRDMEREHEHEHERERERVGGDGE